MHTDISDISAKTSVRAATHQRTLFNRAIAFCMFAYVLCILLTVTPLSRIAANIFLSRLPTNPLLLLLGTWLPANLNLTQDQHASQISTSNMEFLLLIALVFVIYALSALLIQRLPEGANRQAIRLIWLGTLLTGLIFVLTPAMTSHDIFAYASYGRILVTYHANPYFVPPSTFPHDALTSLNDWPNVISAYGPGWLLVCALAALISGSSAVHYILAFRLLAFTAHIVNTLLVTTTLQKMGSSSRTVTLGMLLYALNPLVLLESCLAGHNDIFMVTFVLLGILLSKHAEQHDFSRPSYYLPPIVAFTLAALIKFSAAPFIIIFLVVLLRKALYPTALLSSTQPQKMPPQWQPALLNLLLASMVSGILALAFYLPYWVGHHVHEIVQSFFAVPSANIAENSILRAILDWMKEYGSPDRTSWTYLPLHVFSLRTVWNAINIATLAVALGITSLFLWRVPTTRAIVLVSLATLGAVLVVTPFFYPWYVIWLIGLAVVCLPTSGSHIQQGLVAFALTFSVSAFLTYLFNGYAPFGDWRGFTCLTTIGPPLLVLLFFLIIRTRKGNQPANQFI